MWLASTALAASGDAAFAEGNALLSKGDLSGAMKAYAAAVRADRENQAFSQQFLLVRQVVMLQDRLDKTRGSEQRMQLAMALRSFYTAHGLHERALPLDREMHDRLRTGNSAIQLAETLMSMEREAEAIEILRNLKADDQNCATQALLAVALVRKGDQGEARQVAASVAPDADAGPGTLYLVARMQAAVGEDDHSLTTLKRCFEAVPPSRLEDLKMHARVCADFAALATSDGFRQALKTESKVTESACSGGSSCSSCPMRGGCPSSGGR
jgi:tetratricopeptide (TPR) repeat protein